MPEQTPAPPAPKNAFLKQLLAALLSGAAKTTSAAIDANSDWKTVGVSAGVGALAGLLSAILAHPASAAVPPVSLTP